MVNLYLAATLLQMKINTAKWEVGRFKIYFPYI
jgi:hypothetical protein